MRQKNTYSKLNNILYKKKQGEDLVLTIDHSLQKYIQKLLASDVGCVIVSNPTTGEILASYSSPSFDENNIEKEIDSDTSAMLNRTLQAQYSPGSVFKIVSALYIMDKNIEEDYEDTGFITVGNGNIHNYGKYSYGAINLQDAFANSLNTYFTSKIYQNIDAFILYVKKINRFLQKNDMFHFSNFKIEKSNSEFANALLPIGQGKVTVSPMAIHILTSVIYNEGYYFAPIAVKEILSNDSKHSRSLHSKKIDTFLKPDHCKRLKDMMTRVVNHGTASGFGILYAAGKTGTAELGQNKYNYWFTGFSTKDNPYAITIVLEKTNETRYNKSVEIFKQILKFLGEV